jgi:two-component system, NtrC family, response regulator AtoC
VLVVEDDHNARRAIVRILRLSNFAPLEAQSVKEAIDRLSQHPQWVLLDLMLPDGNGSQVLKRIISDRLDIKVCLTTGCSSSMIDPLRKDVAHVFTKPLDVERLMNVLTQDPSSAAA